jgi:Tol biopolymer transport system component
MAASSVRMIGTTLHHYRIIRSLGRGGMGEVYAAEDNKLNRTVALKVLPQVTAADPERLSRFQREAKAIAALNHPNVVTIYSVEEADGVPFLTMELVEGKPLDALIPRRGMKLAALLELAVPLADAVSAAHQRGIVHRDLKPSNIMVGDDHRLKVLDFGLAKLRQETGAPGANTATVEQLTARHGVIGTASYMSPEQAEGRPVDHRSDIFSLGILLYEMATGTRPFKGESAMSILSAIIKDAPVPAADVNPGVPPELDRVIRRCLPKDPARRYQSAVDLRNDLEDLAHASPPKRRAFVVRRTVPGLAAVAALVAIAAAAVVWRGRGDRVPSATFTKLTSMPGREWFPSLSPDGKWLVYGAETEGNFDIFLQSVSGSNPVNLTKDSAADDDMPAFSPDGDRVAFRSSREGGGIFIMGRTGEAVRRVTRSGFNPAWSPDGTQLAFNTGRMDINPANGESLSELWIVSVNGGQPLRLSEGDAIQPSWSPHGRRIAYASRGGTSRKTDIWTIRVVGGDPVALMNDAPIDWNPIWAPDGKHLYFVSDRSGTMNLWRMAIDEETGRARGEPEPIVTPAPFLAHPTISADGAHLAYSSVLLTTNIQRLGLDSSTAMPVGDPVWVTSGSRLWSSPDPSPDGQFVVYYSRVEPEGDLYVSRADGTGQRQLTGDSALDRVPHWSPDGKWISCFSNRSGKLQIWKVRPDGSDLQQITDVAEESAYSTWSPDGSRLAVTTNLAAKHPESFIIDPSRRWSEQRPVTLPPIPSSQYPLTPNSWSPDGQRLIGFAGPTSPSTGVIMYTFKTQTYEHLTDVGEWPVWLPDSRHVLYGDGGKRFWVLDTQTKQSKPIYSGGRDVLGPPRLTADGRTVYYSRRVTEADIHLMTLR